MEKLDMILKSFQFDTIQFHKDVRMKSPKLSADWWPFESSNRCWSIMISTTIILVNRGLRFVDRTFSERNFFKSFSIFLMLFIISMFRLFSWLFQSSSTLAFNLPVWRSRQLLVRTAAAQIMRKLNWLLHGLVMENETTNNKNNKIQHTTT